LQEEVHLSTWSTLPTHLPQFIAPITFLALSQRPAFTPLIGTLCIKCGLLAPKLFSAHVFIQTKPSLFWKPPIHTQDHHQYLTLKTPVTEITGSHGSTGCTSMVYMATFFKILLWYSWSISILHFFVHGT